MAKSMSHKQSKAYLYEFSHVPENSLLEDFGAFHGQEIEYVFGNLSSILATKEDKALSKTMMDYWVNFAATGDPNGHLLRWPDYDVQSDQNIEFGEGVAVRSNLKKETCDFVEKIRRKHGHE
jgi:para-nitrobenzyl esterase